RRLGQRQAERLQVLRREAGRNFAACEELRAPQAEEIFLLFTGEAHRSFSLYGQYGHGPAWSGHPEAAQPLEILGSRCARRGWWNRPRAAYSTTFGTTKKPSCAAGAFLMMSSGMPPSVTTSGRFFISMGVTEVIGSTPSTSTS